ncbi:MULTISPECIES: zinc-binding dehydrogenase [Paraburkholderia]|uniref:zinc-binding dehydrogenase n=1 Tax=Paraburkholderia TaxID=1822464 RepID=UPI0022540751|nr:MULTISPECIES: zinc-binding dehydrogenase [Paraburkholderia]MCX4163054.1 zinc-binding dehydrogenase [Paraburkholderia megapolitana]MDN7158550.1 zinc-binding dehydrogenase [Paraburkholderia sp. CHISQ3]MDQ6495597.1 zinc-binding dehydrogenase [Paraburkholderia megapolitana]
MKAWQLERLGGMLSLVDRPIPQPRTGGVVVRIDASSLMSYMKDYVDGKLPIYHVPERPFIPGGNGVGYVHAVGPGVWHLKPGQRVVLSSHFVAQENIQDPAEILIGVTANGADAHRMQADWPDGTLAEYALFPASAVTPADDLPQLNAVQLAMTMRCIVPFGGLLRGRLMAGETLVISGATGAYGTAAVMVALAMGAARVVAVGRNAAALQALGELAPGRVKTVAATGDSTTDTDAIRAACGSRAHLAFDMVGNASDPNMTLCALRSLMKGGRLVLMGSMTVPLPVPYTELMLNGWEILGQFMYPRDAYRRLLDLLRSGLLDMNLLRSRVYPLSALPEAMAVAAHASNFECVVIDHHEE